MSDVIFEEKLAEAQLPSTSGARLEVLAQEESLDIRRAVAQNPNTPLKTLLVLGQTFFTEFANNPGLPLFLLEDPGFLQKLPWRLINELTQLSSLPEFLLEALASSEYQRIQENMAVHPQLPAGYLEKFLLSENPSVRRLASSNPTLSLSLLQTLKELGSNDSMSAFEEPSDVPEETLRLFSEKGLWARLLVAKHPQTTPDILTRLSQDESYEVRAEVAANPNTPAVVAEQLLQDPEDFVVRQAAQHPSLPTSVLESLIEAKIPGVWHLLVEREDTSAQALERLLQERANPLRRKMVAHPNMTAELLSLLASDEEEAVRVAVALHPEAPEEALLRLERDAKARVRKAVAKRR